MCPTAIETERLILRAPIPADAQSIFNAYAQDPEVTRYLTWQPHQSVADAERVIANSIAAWEQGTSFPYVIKLNDSGQVIGMIRVNIDRFKVELGYVLARAYWRKGYMTEAVRGVIDWAFTQPHIYRVAAVCDVENAASARVMEKAGMKREGVHKRYTVHPNISDEPRDCYSYAATK
ncbi:MAG: GNAT family N-acetyltransferase [Chloroflexi bacterium]|nr:GNAT family N-acetyltransferase [Chloroflexota bacterium]